MFMSTFLPFDFGNSFEFMLQSKEDHAIYHPKSGAFVLCLVIRVTFKIEEQLFHIQPHSIVRI